MKNILKLDFYDEFSCIADRCPITCCKGWEIAVDKNTYGKWKEAYKPFCKRVRSQSCGEEVKYCIDLGQDKVCPLLNAEGLCSVVIKAGEAYQPETCRMFPRQINSLQGMEEYSLSLTCPEVVDIINDKKASVTLQYSGDENAPLFLLPWFKIREAMITLMQNNSCPLRNRIVLIFYMLLEIRKMDRELSDIICSYQDRNYLELLLEALKEIPLDREAALWETNELFLDIVLNYKEEKHYSNYLLHIARLAKDFKVEDIMTKWEHIQNEWEQYELLFENFFITKIFANCISEDPAELLSEFQIIVMEYVLIRYSVFLKWLSEQKSGRELYPAVELDYKDIRSYIVIYSRMIEYNMEGMKEFLEESFEEAVWEPFYFLLLING